MTLDPKLAKYRDQIREYAASCELDFFEVIYELIDYKNMSVVAAYGGFPNRYPHWRFGMQYGHLSKTYSYGLSKIYEMVINNDPCYAYLLEGNSITDQRMVMAHVYGHSDFFKNNLTFKGTNRKMMDEMGNHRTKVMNMMSRHGIDRVEAWIDACLSLENLIDFDSPGSPRDILKFLSQKKSLQIWQRKMISIVREEAYYFYPQAATKIMNEGWACVTGDTLVSTDQGLMPAKDIVHNKLALNVNDNKTKQKIYDWAVFPKRKTIKIMTRRGISLEGSTTHQVQLVNGNWKRLGKVCKGDKISLCKNSSLWPKKSVRINWKPQRSITLEELAKNIGVSLSTVFRHKGGICYSKKAAAIESALIPYERQLKTGNIKIKSRKRIKVPSIMNESLSSFLGYLVGDGHVSWIKRVIGLTSGDFDQGRRFSMLAHKLFGLKSVQRKDGNRYRILLHSKDLADFLDSLGLLHGFSARKKSVPSIILKSPERIVAAFIRAYFDCDGYAGKSGIKLSTSSTRLCAEIQLLLLNFGILSRRVRQPKNIWHLCIFGKSALRFQEKIGFGLKRKKVSLDRYIRSKQWFKKEEYEDEVVNITTRVADVYDFSVKNTHRYVANGIVNHNSYWHAKMMTEKILHDSELIDFADHHSGTLASSPGRLNPYKMGIELFRDIEGRWNKGKFGREYSQCKNLVDKKNWNQKLGKGREKIFEVRSLYKDLTFLDSFLTEEFCELHQMYTYEFNPSTGAYEIKDRDWRKVKEKLLQGLTNNGHPVISIADPNIAEKEDLVLLHHHEGVDLKQDYAQETLKNLYKLWQRPVHIETIVEGVPKRLSFDGDNPKEESRAEA